MAELLYDPDLRRDTPLARVLAARIRAEGPITVRDYMDVCLHDPLNGYYRTRAAIGREGDFITAPEISQIFGELIGLWCVVVWEQMGTPARINLIELGAGRGTLLADALRAVSVVPAFRAAVTVQILDRNPVLIERQRAALAACGVTVAWHETLDSLPTDVPSVWIGNEFLDTMPVRQLELLRDRWSDRCVGLDAGGRLVFVPDPGALPASGADEAIREDQDFDALASALRARAGVAPLAALFIDYGYLGGEAGDTLQAVREHRAEHVLTSPGEADLSCHVDFGSFVSKIQSIRQNSTQVLAVDGPLTQAEFLGQLGIVQRASKLMSANPSRANAIELGVARLMAPQGMGTQFKAVAVRSAGLPPLPGFEGPSG